MTDNQVKSLCKAAVGLAIIAACAFLNAPGVLAAGIVAYLLLS